MTTKAQRDFVVGLRNRGFETESANARKDAYDRVHGACKAIYLFKNRVSDEKHTGDQSRAFASLRACAGYVRSLGRGRRSPFIQRSANGQAQGQRTILFAILFVFRTQKQAKKRNGWHPPQSSLAPHSSTACLSRERTQWTLGDEYTHRVYFPLQMKVK